MSEWRPIETAPKDGSWFLGYDEDGPRLVCCWSEEVQDWVADSRDIYTDAVTLTHWMPLPDPPVSGP